MFHCSYIGRNRPLLLITSCPCERLRGQGIGRINGWVTRATPTYFRIPVGQTTTPLDTCSLGQGFRIAGLAKSPASRIDLSHARKIVSASILVPLFLKYWLTLRLESCNLTNESMYGRRERRRGTVPTGLTGLLLASAFMNYYDTTSHDIAISHDPSCISIFVPIPDKSVGINNHKCKLRPDQWPNKSYDEANAEREVKRGGVILKVLFFIKFVEMDCNVTIRCTNNAGNANGRNHVERCGANSISVHGFGILESCSATDNGNQLLSSALYTLQ
ncbi:hypothetical protein ALC53_12391 [Atta colombica]|uniref:Uncharacterized protein n=1 Tax=Atta colombica TaxID=520822 RepID=A0A195AYH7_9HYME|nr:hypothetical protein ALC53_12391 [Atta colombica]